MLSPSTPHNSSAMPGFRSFVKRQLVDLTINGVNLSIGVEPRRTLLDVLRHDLHLTGTKKVCDMGNCGACTVLVDNHAMYACLLLAVDCQGRSITTIEGLNLEEAMHSEIDGANALDPIQQAFIEADAFQCGFCTSGQIMSLKGLFHATPAPTDEQILRAVSGNLCRCGAYCNILAAGRIAADAQTVTLEDLNGSATNDANTSGANASGANANGANANGTSTNDPTANGTSRGVE